MQTKSSPIAPKRHPPPLRHIRSRHSPHANRTTTAWTLPANQALNVNPELVYALVNTEKGALVLAESLVEK
ncbi:MAG: hypothetical protein EBZ05_06780, partial [Verrucomicrobia bacterium]|nr:hypothetical protein [Verrucomicrobiota bacterium]